MNETYTPNFNDDEEEEESSSEPTTPVCAKQFVNEDGRNKTLEASMDMEEEDDAAEAVGDLTPLAGDSAELFPLHDGAGKLRLRLAASYLLGLQSLFRHLPLLSNQNSNHEQR